MKTRTNNIILLLFILFPGASLPADESLIEEIRKEYKAIRNAMPTYSKQDIEVSGYSTDGSMATVYRDNNCRIRLIISRLYGESGKVIEEFYYKDGDLFFAFSQSHQYNAPYSVTEEIARDIPSPAFDPEKTVITENRYYFVNNRMIRWLDRDKNPVNSDTDKFRKTGEDVLEFSNELLSIIQENNKNRNRISH